MGLKDLFQSQSTIRELRGEVAALHAQQAQAARQAEGFAEQAATAKSEAERTEAGHSEAVQHERRSVEHELFGVLQPLLLSLPTAREAIRQNPALLAKDMIGMFQPAEDFIRVLGLTVIGPVGKDVPYDSTCHDCPAMVEVGHPVRIVTVGYCRGEEIWIKARVKEL